MSRTAPSSPGSSGTATVGRNRLLVLAATAMELAPLQDLLRQSPQSAAFDLLVCGVGPVASAATLAAHLATRTSSCAGVVLSGVGGLYPQESANSAGLPGLLDICLAEREILADFGIAAPHGAEPFSTTDFDVTRDFPLRSPLTGKAAELLAELAVPFYRGAFLTLNAATATRERGLALRDRHQGLCENMEGAAVALVCRRFDLPLLEIRCISNMVEDRDLSRWRLAEAIGRQAEVMARLLPKLAVVPLTRAGS